MTKVKELFKLLEDMYKIGGTEIVIIPHDRTQMTRKELVKKLDLVKDGDIESIDVVDKNDEVASITIALGVGNGPLLVSGKDPRDLYKSLNNPTHFEKLTAIYKI